MKCRSSKGKELICSPRGSLVWRSMLWTQRLWKQTRQAGQHHQLLPYQLSGNIRPMLLAGATPSLHLPECHRRARSQLRPLPLPGLRLGPRQLPQRGRHPGWRKATNPFLPGRLPPVIPWAWWMKPLLPRISTKPSPQTSAWQPSANCCLSRQWSGRPGCLTKHHGKQAARLGARAKAAVRAELPCHHLSHQQRVLSPLPLVILVTGPCPDSGSLRGL